VYDRDFLKELERAAAAWEKKISPGLAKRPERKERFETISEAEVKRLYTPADVSGLDYLEELGWPGEYPYTRGVQPTMYRGRLWTMRQYAGFASARESNRRYRYLLDQGGKGLSVAFDLPTQIGYDSDHDLARGEVGKVGVAIDSLADMEILFDQIPLDKVSTSMTINAPASILLAMYMAVAEKQGVGPEKLTGTIQNDILKEYAARGTYIFPPKPSMRIITNIFAYCAAEVPRFNTISISGYHIREAGSTAAQEVAFTLADGIAYVQAALGAGLKVDDFAPRLSFFFNSHLDFLEEVAKFRAARRLWARIMKERFQAADPRSMMLRFHTQTAGCSLTAQQPENNIVRVAYQALAAVLGGTQSLHTNSMDEALSLPTEKAVMIALRTQQIAAYESGAAETIDPLAGSFYVEAQTGRIEAEAGDYIRRIDEMGGAVEAIEKGFIQREIQDSAYRYQRAVEEGRRIVVGVNKFQIAEEPSKDRLRVNPAVREEQALTLAELRSRRDGRAVEEARARLATLDGRLRAGEKALVEAQGQRRDLERDTDEVARQVAWRQGLVEQLDGEASRLEATAGSLRADLERLAAEKGAADEQVAATQAHLDELRGEVLYQRLSEARTAAAMARGRWEHLQAALAALEEGQARLEAQIGSKQERVAGLDEEQAALAQQVAGQSSERKVIHGWLAALSEKIDPAEAEEAMLEEERESLEGEEATLRAHLRAAESGLSEAMLAQNRQEDRLDRLRRQIMDDFGLVEMEPTEGLPEQPPLPLGEMVSSLPVVDRLPEGLEDEIHQLKAQVRRMGAVNPSAPEEYAEVLDRHTFLTSQVSDLEEAAHSLREVIAELDEVMRSEFSKTFEAVAARFKDNFAELFGGGTARLVLTEPDDIGQTGVEIVARPPGKRQQTLALLSGGERSLTAVALVFALLEVSPPPFCVLDEVDAMLDEANVKRFRAALERLSEHTQFIVITHNRGTIQAADTIYGVSMGEDSVSQVVSLRLEGERIARPDGTTVEVAKDG